jgi:hypothetical protein
MGGDMPPAEGTGGCPACKSPDIHLPEDSEEDAVITCKNCGRSAPKLIFFKAGEE